MKFNKIMIKRHTWIFKTNCIWHLFIAVPGKMSNPNKRASNTLIFNPIPKRNAVPHHDWPHISVDHSESHQKKFNRPCCSDHWGNTMENFYCFQQRMRVWNEQSHSEKFHHADLIKRMVSLIYLLFFIIKLFEHLRPVRDPNIKKYLGFFFFLGAFSVNPTN